MHNIMSIQTKAWKLPSFCLSIDARGHRVRYFYKNSYFEELYGHQVRYLLNNHAKALFVKLITDPVSAHSL